MQRQIIVCFFLILFSFASLADNDCDYTLGEGIAVPINGVVEGYSESSAIYPHLCPKISKATCDKNKKIWNETTPLYTECVQNCRDPDTQKPVPAGTEYIFFNRRNGTNEQCESAKTVSICQGSKSLNPGIFIKIIPRYRFPSCLQTCFHPESGENRGPDDKLTYFSKNEGSLAECQGQLKITSICNQKTSFEYKPALLDKNKRFEECRPKR